MQAGCAYPLVMTTVASPTRRWIAPALQRLLADIAAGRVDIVVVYKIDRLTNLTADKLLVHSRLPLGA